MIYKTIKRKLAFTLIEVLVAMGIAGVLSVSLYQMMSAMRKGYSYTNDKLEILNATRMIVARIRNELRMAIRKPEVNDDKIYIPIAEDQTIIYYFDEAKKELYRATKGAMNEGDPSFEEFHKFKFKDGQLILFDFTSSYTNEKYIASELSLNPVIWCKATIKVIQTEKALTEEEKAKIYADPDSDDRVKTFLITITPRKLNWQLQSTK